MAARRFIMTSVRALVLALAQSAGITPPSPALNPRAMLGFAAVVIAGLLLRRGYALLLLPVAIWFALAPVALRAPAVFAPGHLLIAGAMSGAAAAHLQLLRGPVRLVGAGVIAVTLATLAVINLWIAAFVSQPDAPATGRGLMVSVVVCLVAALGM